MATSFNLQEYILFRTEIKRELTNNEVDTNFKMVSNPWVATRIYEIGNIVYHPVIIDDPATTGQDQVLAWWRSNIRTTQGVFDTSQWDMIGGIGSGNINIQGANSFGKIKVNSSAATGPLSTGFDAILTSANPNDTFSLVAGAGMQLQYNIGNKVIKLINTLATNPGEINAGKNIGQGVGHQDVYAGKVGLDLEFNGFQATNTTNAAGEALSVSTNAIQNNIEYNFNEGNVDLSKLNSGLPLISMLSNVSGSSPANGDIFQYSTGNGSWGPVSISVLGGNNLYTVDGLIGGANRIVNLFNAAGNLQFNKTTAQNTGVHISNLGTTHQIQLRNASITGNAATQYALNNVVRATTGIYGTDGSFGINIDGTGLVGLTGDSFSLSGVGGGSMYVPQIATDAITTVESFRIPLVDIGATNKGRFDSTSSYRAGSYSDQGGAIDMISILHEGDYSLKGVSNINVASAISFSFDNEHDFAANTSLTDGYGILMSYKTPTNKEADTIINHMDKTNRRFTGYNFAAVNSTMPALATVNQYLGSNITLDDMAASTPPIINVGSIINFSDTTGGAGGQPQRVGLYSNVVSSYTGAGSQDGGQSITQLITDSGTWAGYFVGCVNIDQGGLVLPSSAVAPVCNGVSGGSVVDRTLWINSTNGHLYRGYVDVEDVFGSISLRDLTDVTLSIDPTAIPDDSLLVYNLGLQQWEAATLSAYNLEVVAFTDGSASIQLSDGAASSDVDLIPGTNITFAIDEAADSITINSTVSQGAQGAQGNQGFQGTTGAQGNQGFQGTTGAQGNQGFQGTTGSQGTTGAQGVSGVGSTPALTLSGTSATFPRNSRSYFNRSIAVMNNVSSSQTVAYSEAVAMPTSISNGVAVLDNYVLNVQMIENTAFTVPIQFVMFESDIDQVNSSGIEYANSDVIILQQFQPNAISTKPTQYSGTIPSTPAVDKAYTFGFINPSTNSINVTGFFAFATIYYA